MKIMTKWQSLFISLLVILVGTGTFKSFVLAQFKNITATVKLSICGNGQLEGGEDCEGSDLGGKNCPDFGYSGGTLTCDIACSYDFSRCVSPSPTPTPSPSVLPAATFTPAPTLTPTLFPIFYSTPTLTPADAIPAASPNLPSDPLVSPSATNPVRSPDTNVFSAPAAPLNPPVIQSPSKKSLFHQAAAIISAVINSVKKTALNVIQKVITWLNVIF